MRETWVLLHHSFTSTFTVCSSPIEFKKSFIPKFFPMFYNLKIQYYLAKSWVFPRPSRLWFALLDDRASFTSYLCNEHAIWDSENYVVLPLIHCTVFEKLHFFSPIKIQTRIQHNFEIQPLELYKSKLINRIKSVVFRIVCIGWLISWPLYEVLVFLASSQCLILRIKRK